MCDTCGCSVTPGNVALAQQPVPAGTTTVDVLQRLLSVNDHAAAHNREHFARHSVLAINLMSSPGAGKTALLEATIDAVRDRMRIGVIEGDLATENDADRIRAKGVPAHQIVTGTACHLDAHMVHDALHYLDLTDLDVVFIENVGNLVCPAAFDLGHHLNVTLLSVTEGDDKPQKYPVMFRAGDVTLITKSDLLAFIDDFDVGKAARHVRELATEAPVLQVSTRGDGLEPWLTWLERQRAAFLDGAMLRPRMQADGVSRHAHDHAHDHHHAHDHGGAR